MADILKMPVALTEPLVWSCVCGNQSFFVCSDGTIKCTGCSEFQPGVDIVMQKVNLHAENER